jgi:hypothetical protein
MKKPEWYDVLQPREAVIAGLVGLAVVCPLTLYAMNHGYIVWSYSARQQKDFGTAIIMLGFAVPYLLTKWLLKRRHNR